MVRFGYVVVVVALFTFAVCRRLMRDRWQWMPGARAAGDLLFFFLTRGRNGAGQSAEVEIASGPKQEPDWIST